MGLENQIIQGEYVHNRNLMRVRQLVELNVFQPRNLGNVRLVFNERPNDLFAAFRQPHACAYVCNKVCRS